jgi:hypothetical protein
VLQRYPVFAFEGPAYYALTAPGGGSEDLYRFFNTRTGAHFYTTSAPERDHVKATWPWFTFEGVAYPVYADVAPGGGGGGGGSGVTTTALFSSANPAAVGASVTLVATVSGTAPTGTIAFTDGGVPISGCAAVAAGTSGNIATAVCTSSALAAGSHPIMATYAGDAVNASSSNTLTQTITGSGGGAASTTTVASSANPAAVGATVTFTASVTGDAPTGSVTFTDGGNPMCAVVPVGAGGTATCSTNALAAGTHTIKVVKRSGTFSALDAFRFQ